MIRRFIVVSLLIAVAVVSGELIGAERSQNRGARPPATPIGKVLQPAWSAISPAAQIFLVAGGRDSANFAQEVADQKKFWLAHGYTASQIECFYAVPSPAQTDDADQFRSLEEDLRTCHLAAPDIILAAITDAARDYKQDFFYLYVTSHGTDPPLARQIDEQLRRNPNAKWFVEAHDAAQADPLSAAHLWFSPYRMEVEGTKDASGWGWMSFSARYLNAQKRPEIRIEDQLFTPKYLAKALQEFPVSVKKIVVLQACHSGGFVLPPDKAPDPAETLVTVQNITVLTAARADRTSFGCDTSDHTTYYGGALQQVLDASPDKDIPQRKWQRIHKQVSGKVKALESKQKIPRNLRSLPQYFSNW